MTDGVAITAGSGTTILTDDTGAGGHAQVVKLAISTDGSGTLLPASSGYGLSADVTRLPAYVTDTFGTLRVGEAVNDIEVQFHRDVPANLVTITAAGTPNGTANNTTVPGLMQMATGTGATGEIQAVSRDAVVYRAGGEIFCLVTAAWIDGGVSNSFQRIGLYDANNGFFVGYEGTSFGITSRAGGSDTTVAQASFNVDTLGGAAGSKFTSAGSPVAANFAYLNVFRIRFGWLGAAPIKFEILSPDGEWVLFHVIRQPNTSASPSIQTTDLPITAHLKKASGASTIRLNTACWAAGVTYPTQDQVVSYTLGTTVNNAATLNVYGVSTIRARVGTTATGTAIWEATIDGTNWFTHPTVFLQGAAGASDTPVIAAFTPTSGDLYRMQSVGYRGIRCRTATTMNNAVTLHFVLDENMTIATVNVPPGAKSFTKAEDVGSADADVGIPAMAVQKATPANTAGSDGDYEFLQMSAGRLWVNASNNGTFATQVDGAALTSLQLIDDPVIADDAAFTPATSKVMMAGFTLDNTSTDVLDEGDAGAARITTDRRQIVALGESGANYVRGGGSKTDNSAQSLMAASGNAATSNFLCWVTIYNSSATNTAVEIRDGTTTVVAVIPAPAYGGATFVPTYPIKMTANTATNAYAQTGVTTLYMYGGGYVAV